VKKVLNIVNKTWKYQLKRRVEGLLKDFSDAEATEDRRVSLIHANSFRWPASLEKLDLRDIPELSNLKRAIENSKKKNKIKLEWMDSLSTVEIEVNEEVALLSLFQYWIVLKIIQDSEIPEEMLEKKLKTYKQHIAPFISQGILQIDSSRGVVEQSVHFSNASQWRNLLPQYEIEESTEKVTEHKKLINLSIDSYVTRQLKSVSPQKEDDIIRKITEKQNANKDTVQKRIDSLVSKGLLSKSQKENSSVAWLEYIP
ncbi:hypothetical protein NEMIN01_1992, partial [Nematocida minor]|uniref:uncharacterized protein n=1 Tax=Nematocida minor TaxID=1912983 RepID=UPI00221F7D18